METSGWSINFGVTLAQIGQCGDAGSWTAFTGSTAVGSMSYTFSGEGTFKLTFSNCFNQGYVPVLYNGTEIGRSTTENDVQMVEQAYENGTVLELRDEGENSVVRILEFITTINCDQSKNFFSFFKVK